MNTQKYNRFIAKKHADISAAVTMKLKDLDAFPGPITVLFAPNGCGKTTTIKAMKAEAEKQGFIISHFASERDDAKKYVAPLGNAEDYLKGLQSLFQSEGERISISVEMWADKDLMPKLLQNKDPIRIFIDEGDSGLSYDRIKHTLSCLIFICEMETKKFHRDIKIIMTGNSYELMRAMESLYTQFIWLPTKEEWKPKDFTEFIAPYEKFYTKHLDKED